MHAEAAGAAAAIVYDNEWAVGLEPMAAMDVVPPDVGIPSAFVHLASGDAMLRLLRMAPAGAVRAKLEPSLVTVEASLPQVRVCGRPQARQGAPVGPLQGSPTHAKWLELGVYRWRLRSLAHGRPVLSSIT